MCVDMWIVDESVNHGFAKVMWTCACCMQCFEKLPLWVMSLGCLTHDCDNLFIWDWISF